MTCESPVEQPSDYDDMLRGIKAIAEGLRGIQELGVAQYTPIVDLIIATASPSLPAYRVAAKIRAFPLRIQTVDGSSDRFP